MTTNHRIEPAASALVQRAGTCPSGGKRRVLIRRGIAMMMVMGVLAAVSVMTAAALTSQQNAPQMGVNAVADVQARWSAESAASIAAAVLETNFNYSGANAEMMEQQAVAAGLADVRITTLDGRVPTADDLELILTAKSTYAGVTREVQKRISLTPVVPIDQAADPHLNEFGVVATNAMEFDDTVTVTKWGLSPARDSVKPVALGYFATTGTGLVLGASLSLGGVSLYAGADADAGLAAKITGDMYALGGRQLPYKVPVTSEIEPAAFGSLPVAAASDLDVNGTGVDVTLPTGGKFETLSVQNRGVCRLNQTKGTHYSVKDLKVANAGVLLIEGVVLLEVRSAMTVVNRSAITLSDANSALVIYTKGDIEIDDSGVGVPRDVARNIARSPSSLTAYSNPLRLRIFPQPISAGGTSNPDIRIDTRSLVVATIHAPTARFRMEDSSALLGRVTAQELRVRTSSMLCYDPVLDRNTGFTNEKSILFASDGSAVPVVATALSTFDSLLGTTALKSTLATLTAVPVEEEQGEQPVLAGSVTSRTSRLATALPIEPDTDRNNNQIPDAEEVTP